MAQRLVGSSIRCRRGDEAASGRHWLHALRRVTSATARGAGFLHRPLSQIGLLVAAICATAGPAYLPIVGPPALRFEAPLIPSAGPTIILPPLAAVERPSTAAIGEPPAPAVLSPPAESTNAPPLFTPFDPNAPNPLAIEPSATNLVNSPAAETELLAPQMFLKYFTGRHGTNTTGVSLFAPVGFVPPLPVTPPSRSATFQTTAPGKP